MRVKIPKEVAKFLENNASIVTTNGDRYMYLPFWFKCTSDPAIFEELSWDQLPQDLRDFVKDMREEEKP